MERAASVAHSTQSERPQRPEGMYRKFSSMPGSDWQAPPTVDQYMGRPSIHAGRSASMAASEPSLPTNPVALPVDLQVRQAAWLLPCMYAFAPGKSCHRTSASVLGAQAGMLACAPVAFLWLSAGRSLTHSNNASPTSRPTSILEQSRTVLQEQWRDGTPRLLLPDMPLWHMCVWLVQQLELHVWNVPRASHSWQVRAHPFQRSLSDSLVGCQQ